MTPQIKKEQYISLLKEYNTHTNIYSSKAYDKLPFHINDCEILASLIDTTPQTIVDMGSGSGLPSVILAIHHPQSHVIAIESKSRKTAFLEQVKDSLSLENLTVLNKDINAFIRSKTIQPNIITAKAFAPYNTAIKLGRKMAHHNTILYIPISQTQYQLLSSLPNVEFELISPQNNYFFLKKTYN